jgi:hypothetical protein
MTRKIRYFGVILTLGLLAFLSLASGAPIPFFQATATPTPKMKAVVSLESQAGHSDGIVVLGILLFVFIAVPIILRYRNLRTQKEPSL